VGDDLEKTVTSLIAKLNRHQHDRRSPSSDIVALEAARNAADYLDEKIGNFNLNKNEEKKKAEKLLRSLLPNITRQTRSIFTEYTQNEVVPKELYEILTAGDVPAITSIGMLTADIYTRIASINAKIAPQFSGYNFYKKVKEFLQGIAGDIKFANDQARHNFIVRKRVVERLDDLHQEYVDEHNRLDSWLDAYTQKVERLIESTDSEEVLNLLAQWTKGDREPTTTHYNLTVVQEAKEFTSAVTSSTKITPEERKAYLAKLTSARTLLDSSLPARAAWVMGSIDEALRDDRDSYDHLLTVEDDTITSRIDDFTERFWLMKAAYDHLNDKTVMPLIENATKHVTGTPLGFSNILLEAENQMTFLKSEHTPLHYFAEVAAGKHSVLDVDVIKQLAKMYGLTNDGMFMNPRWQKRSVHTGAYGNAERLRQQTLEKIATAFAESAREQESIEEQYILRKGNLPVETLDRTKSLQQLVTLIDKEAAKYNDEFRRRKHASDTERSSPGMEKKPELKYAPNFYQTIERLPEFDMLRRSLKPNAALRDARDRINGVGREGFLGARDAMSYASIYAIYQEFEERLSEHVENLPTSMQGSEVLEKIIEEQERRIRHKLVNRAEALTGILKVELDRPSRALLKREIQALDNIITISAAVGRKTESFVAERVKYATLYERTPEDGRYEETGEKLTLYVLDTNILLGNEHALEHFSRLGMVVIPSEVLIELDHLKTLDGDVGYLARRANDRLNKIGFRDPDERGETFIRKDRVILYDRLARLRRKVHRRNGHKYELRLNEIMKNFRLHPDEYIRRSAQSLTSDRSTLFSSLRWTPAWQRDASNTVFVTNDVVSGLLASPDLEVTDFLTHNAQRNLNHFYPGFRNISLPRTLQQEVLSREFTDAMLENILDVARLGGHWVSHDNKRLEIASPLVENEFVFCQDPGQTMNTVMLRYKDGRLHPLYSLPGEARQFPLRWIQEHPDVSLAPSIRVTDEEQIAARDLFFDADIEVVTIQGVGGTGKTKFSVSTAAQLYKTQEALFDSRLYETVHYTMPATTVDGKNLGALPGGLLDKQGPWIKQFQEFMGQVESYVGPIPVEVIPLSVMRGRDLKGIRIIDEAQNTWKREMKTLVTRHSDPALTIVLGDPEQIDTRAGFDHGFSHLRLAFVGQDNYGHMTFTQSRRSRVARQASMLLPYGGIAA